MSAAAALPAGSPRDIRAVAELVQAHAGIVLPPEKAAFVASRLGGAFRQSGLARFADYVDRLRLDAGARHEAIEALTTNHTGFFRESHHFAHFSRTVRPGLLAKAARGEPVRLWSAGSSTGEEVHSLALTLLGRDRDRARPVLDGDVRLLATDINARVLATGRGGRYPAASAAPIPPVLRAPWIAERDGEIVLADELRELVRFRRLNLLEDWPITTRFDAIFCRNTMIYFDDPTKKRLLARLTEHLLPGGHLYIGHSERVIGPAERSLEPLGNTIYRKRAA